MSLRAKLNAIKPLTISLFWKMVDQTAYYKLVFILVLASNSMYQWAFVGVEVSKN